MTYLTCSQKGQHRLIKTNTCRSEETPRLRQEQRSRIGLNSLYVRFTIKHLIRAVSLGPAPKKKKFSEWVYMLRLYLRGMRRRRKERDGETKHCAHYINKDYVSARLLSEAFRQTEKADRALSLSLRHCRSLSINMLRCIDCFFFFFKVFIHKDRSPHGAM